MASTDVEDGSQRLCWVGCGFPCAPGLDKNGQPYVTCCKSCALSGSHDADCPGALAIIAALDPEPEVSIFGHGHGSPLPPAASRLPKRLCVKGCGRSAAHGYETCCRECATSGGLRHGEMCGFTPQQRERLNLERRWYQQYMKWRLSNSFYYSYDPLWGEVKFSALEDDKSTRRQKAAYFCFVSCPCIMATFGCFKSEVHEGLSKADVRRAWKRLLLSGSFIFAVAQLALLIIPLCLFGMVPLSENPMFGPAQWRFDEMGARNASRIQYDNEWWRLFSAMFLHGGWIHLLGNLAVQLRTALVLECLWGTPIWLLIFLGSGSYASLASCIFLPNHLSVGASGALCGVIGAWLPFILITWNQTLPNDRKKRNVELGMVGFGILLLIPTSFFPMTDFAAHIGGLVMGVSLAIVVFSMRLQDARWRWATMLFGLILVSGLLSTSLWWFLTQVNPPKALLHVGG